MSRFTNGLIGGIAVGIIFGTAMATTEKQRRRITRDSKRALRKAGHYFEDLFE